MLVVESLVRSTWTRAASVATTIGTSVREDLWSNTGSERRVVYQYTLIMADAPILRTYRSGKC